MAHTDDFIQTDCFGFVEMSARDPDFLDSFLRSMGFSPIARHKDRPITLYRQGFDLKCSSNIIVNMDPDSYAVDLVKHHGDVCITGICLTVDDGPKVYDQVIARGAINLPLDKFSFLGSLPAVGGIGNTAWYLSNWNDLASFYENFFVPFPDAVTYPEGFQLRYIDHVAHNVMANEMSKWHTYLTEVFDFILKSNYEINFNRTFYQFSWDANKSGRIRLTVHEPKDDISTVAEFLKMNKGSGAQHVAFRTHDIFSSIRQAKKSGMEFLTTPDTYYDLLAKRLPNHGYDTADLKKLQILVDGEEENGETKTLLQIFTKMLVKPIFFEMIDRRGFSGLGEGNVEALSEALELDQIRRGAI